MKLLKKHRIIDLSLLLKMGMSVEQIAQELKVDLEAVRLAAQQNT
ncbi:hypothetical protein NUACC26_032250 [Scytonema sp. NUACC26]